MEVPADARVPLDHDVPLDQVAGALARRDGFAGSDFTAAAGRPRFPLEAAAIRANALADRPHVAAWRTRRHARPADRAGRAAGGAHPHA